MPYIADGGSIIPGSGGGNSNLINICNNIIWNAGSGTLGGPTCLPAMDPCGAVVLPIELMEFTASEIKEGIHLVWKTLTEKNNLRFELERSDNAADFIPILSHLQRLPVGTVIRLMNMNLQMYLH